MKIEIPGMIHYENSMVDALVEGKTINEFEPEGLISDKLKKNVEQHNSKYI